MATYTSTDQENDESLFEYGDPILYNNLTFMRDRVGIAQFLTYGLMQESISEGIDIIVEGDENSFADFNDQAQQVMKSMIEVLIEAGGLARLYGESLLVIFEGEDGSITLKAFENSKYRLTYDKLGNIIKAEIRESIHSSVGTIEHPPIEGDALKNVFHLKWKTGKSYIEPIFDNIWSLSQLYESATQFTRRIGSGLPVMYVDEQLLKNPTIQTMLDESLKGLNKRTRMILPTSKDGGETKFELYTGQGVSVDFTVFQDLHLHAISSYSKIPKSVFIGVEQGQLIAGKVNQTSYFHVLINIQNWFEGVMLWLVGRLAEKFSWNVENIAIVYRLKPEMGESEAITIQGQKIAMLIDLMLNSEMLGITDVEEAKRIVGLTK